MPRLRKYTDAEQAEKRRKYNKAYALRKKQEIKEYYKQYNSGVRGVVIGDRGYVKKCPNCSTPIKRTAPTPQPTLEVVKGEVVVNFL